MESPSPTLHRWTLLANAAGWLGGATVIGWFAVLLFQHHIHYVPEVDCQGYFLIARSFSQFEWPRWPEDFSRFVGHVWIQVGDHQVMAKYPPGWPALLTIGYWLAGLAGALWVNPVLAVIGAGAFFLLLWRLFNAPVACIGTTLWVFSPLVPFYMNYPLSHSADVAVTLLAFLFTVVAAQTGRPWAFVAAGCCSGFLPAIRPVNILLWPALAAMFWATQTARPFRWRAGLVAFAGSVALLAAYNWLSFGAPWRTGYALTGEQSGFDWRSLGSRWPILLATAQSFLEPRWWCLILAGALVSWRRWKMIVAVVLWLLPLPLLYLGYYYFHPNEQFSRFLLAGLPAWILWVGFLLPQDPRWRLVALAIFGVWLALVPPAFLVRLRQHQAGQEFTSVEDQQFAAVRLAGMFHRLPQNIIRPTVPAALYATGRTGWTFSAAVGAVNYDLASWRDRHFESPLTADCARAEVWEDPRRHAARHEWYARTDRQQDFLTRIRHDLGAGRAVFFMDESGWPMRAWLACAPDLVVAPTENSNLLQIRRVLPASQSSQ